MAVSFVPDAQSLLGSLAPGPFKARGFHAWRAQGGPAAPENSSVGGRKVACQGFLVAAAAAAVAVQRMPHRGPRQKRHRLLAAASSADDKAEAWFQSLAAEESSAPFGLSLLTAALSDTPMSGQGLQALQELAAPSKLQEPWRYTDLEALLYSSTSLQSTVGSIEQDGRVLEEIQALLEDELPEQVFRLVFLDGVFVPSLSRTSHDAEGPLIGGFEVLNGRSDLQERVKELLRPLPEVDFFQSTTRDALGCAKLAALNQALHRDAAVISCPASEVKREVVVQLVFVSSGANDRAPHCPRILVDAGTGSTVQVLESHLSLTGSDASLTNALCRVILGEGAEVRHDLLQQKADGARIVESITAEVGPSASYELRLVQSGARAARFNAAVAHCGESSSSRLTGVMVADHEQQLDLHSLIHHRVPSCESKQQHKNIVSGSGECIFKGSIRVDSEAQKTESSQICRSLLLTKKAKVKAMPSLQIRADDVSCSHGAALTELDKNEVFYLMSRGLSPQAARQLLLVAYPQDLLTGLSETAPKSYARVLDKLAQLAVVTEQLPA